VNCAWNAAIVLAPVRPAAIYALTAALTLLVILYQKRAALALRLRHRHMQEGDYDGALRVLHRMSLGVPNPVTLHAEGLTLSLAGRPAEAVRKYRVALAQASGASYRRERLHACLGFALADLGKYSDAERCFHDAIEAGDTTGNSQDGLAGLRLVQGIEPAVALNFAQQAIEHAKRRPDGHVPGAYYGHQAWALALLNRPEEAREALQRDLSDPSPSAFGRAGLHWRTGMALLALQQPDEARRHFALGRDADPHGKYGRRCQEMLQQ